MNNVNKTLYIPLYGKAFVSRKGIILRDTRAEEIWAAEGFALKGKSRSKWLAYYMGIRAAVFDRWAAEQMDAQADAVVVHIGCGMDSRAERVGTRGHLWFDVDFPEVIEERKRYYRQSDGYRMIGSDIRDRQWLGAIGAGGEAIVIMEGVSMYLQLQELRQLLRDLKAHFSDVQLLMDCYTEFAAKASRYKNPINDVGVTQVYGIDDPLIAAEQTGFTFVREHEMTPQPLIDELQGMERRIFRSVFGGKFAQKMYRLYEYN